MQLRGQIVAVRHRIQITIQAVDDDDPRLVSLYRLTHDVCKLARRDFDRIDLADQQFARASAFDEVGSQSPGARQQSAFAFIENKGSSVVTACSCRGSVQERDGGLSTSRGSNEERTGPGLDTPSH